MVDPPAGRHVDGLVTGFCVSARHVEAQLGACRQGDDLQPETDAGRALRGDLDTREMAVIGAVRPVQAPLFLERLGGFRDGPRKADTHHAVGTTAQPVFLRRGDRQLDAIRAG